MWRHAYPTEEEKVRHDVQEQMVHKMNEEEGWGDKAPESTAVHAERRE